MLSDAGVAALRDMEHNIALASLKDIAGAGNICRHDYEDVSAQLVWDTVQLALSPLRDVVAQELAAPE